MRIVASARPTIDGCALNLEISLPNRCLNMLPKLGVESASFAASTKTLSEVGRYSVGVMESWSIGGMRRTHPHRGRKNPIHQETVPPVGVPASAGGTSSAEY